VPEYDESGDLLPDDSGGGGGGNFLTRKLGPLPTWAWLIIGVIGGFIILKKTSLGTSLSNLMGGGSSTSSGAAGTSDATSGDTGTSDIASESTASDYINSVLTTLAADASTIAGLNQKVKTDTATINKDSKIIKKDSAIIKKDNAEIAALKKRKHK
jgi:hypothetical protein